MPGQLTTIANLKDWLGITGGDSDAFLDRIILAAEARIRGICNSRTSFLTGTYVENFDGNNSQMLRLKHTPVASITSIVNASGTVDASTYSLNSGRGVVGFTYAGRSTKWSTAFASGQIVTGQSFPSPSFGDNFNDVVVTYIGGYANIAAVPADLSQAALELAAIYYQSRDRDPGLQSETMGAYSWTKSVAGEEMENIMAKLSPYTGGSVL